MSRAPGLAAASSLLPERGLGPDSLHLGPVAKRHRYLFVKLLDSGVPMNLYFNHYISLLPGQKLCASFHFEQVRVPRRGVAACPVQLLDLVFIPSTLMSNLVKQL